MILIRFLCLFIVMTVVTACSNPLGDSSVVDNLHQPGVSDGKVIPAAKGSDFISSSQQGVRSVSGRFIVKGSLGDPASGVYTRLPSGKKVFMNIQGEILSSDEVSQ